MKKILFNAVAALLLVLVSLPASAQLQFKKDKTFKIVQFTDIHWRPGNPKSDAAALNISSVLDAEKPDLVIITGDIVFAEPAREALDCALKPIIERGIPFGITLGNHDAENDWTPRQIYDYVSTLPNNLTSTTPGISGTTNYILTLKSATDKKKDAAVLYVLDSQQYSQEKDLTDGYDWIKFDQIEWYRKSSTQFTAANGGTPLPSLAFFHIPVPEFNQAAADTNTLMIGTRKETPCSPKINTGLYSAMLLGRDVMGIFVGHDHVDDFVADWKGIALAYGRYSGGSTVYNDIQGGNGARVIVLTEGERGFRTWIRLHEGNKIINEINYPADFKRGE